MVGQGPFRETLARRVAVAGYRRPRDSAGTLRRAGIAQWMRAADVFCLPSYSEGCPNVVVEALACGRPMVATNVGGIPELVKEACGLLIPPRDAAALRRALDTALSKQWDSAEIARTSTRSWDTVAAETLAVCRKVNRLPSPTTVLIHSTTDFEEGISPHSVR